ncbi:MAG: D-alanine--D-alanine ligase family protein [Christensenellales bacterium]|jgi:D-alanine-D-alanine ligase
MKKLAVVFGGKSVEHDVSIVTGSQVIENADKTRYEIIPIYISREGKWYTGDKLKDVKYFAQFRENDPGITRVFLPAESGAVLMAKGKGGLFGGGMREVARIDAAILAMHGMHGEDGTLQGLFELAEIPYANPGVVGSAAGMDKIVMKSVFRGNGFPILDYCYFTRDQWLEDENAMVQLVESKLCYPVFVKPANLGSSIGIGKATDTRSLKDAVEVAICYDKRVLVENGVGDLMEINCSSLSVKGKVAASVCEQPVNWKDFLDFEGKYLSGGKTKGMQSLNRIVPAPISQELTQEIQEMTKQIALAMDCKGVTRIDYIFDRSAEKIYVNEINTIPGSFAFYLWEKMGISFPELIDHLVEDAEYARQQSMRNNYAYDSNLLNQVKKGGVKK